MSQSPHRQLPHLSGAHHQHAFAGEALLGERRSGQLYRRRRDGYGVTSDRGLRARAFPDAQSLLESSSQVAANHSLIGAGSERATHLAEDLGLTDDHRVDPRTHTEQMSHRGLVVIRVEVIHEVLGRHVAELGQEIAKVLSAAVELRHHGVHLDAIAGRQDRTLEHVLVVAEVGKRFGQLLLGDGEPFEKADGCGAMVESDND